MTEYKGQCACGDIEYSFDGEPINTAFCFCTECQVHTGSDKWFGLWVPIDKLRFTKGKPQTFTRLGDSGKDMHHRFCASCGTTLCIDVTVAGFYSVAASTLTSDHNFTPKMSIYVASASQWATFPEGIPRFDKLPTDMGE